MFERVKKFFGIKLEETAKSVTYPREMHSPVFTAKGSSGTAIFSGYFDEEYLAELSGQQATDIYDKMRRNDGRVKMCLAAVMNPIKSAAWEVQAVRVEEELEEEESEEQPANEKEKPLEGDGGMPIKENKQLEEEYPEQKPVMDPENPEAPLEAQQEMMEEESSPEEDLQEEIKEFVEHVLFCDSGKPWKERLGEMLSLLVFGHAVYEVSDTVVKDHPKFGTYNGVNLGFRSQKTIYRWNLEQETGKLLSIQQDAYGDLERTVEIPGDSLMVLSLDKEGDNYEGISALRSCYGSWKRKQVYLKLMAIGIERNAVPTPIIDFPDGWQGTTQYTELLANVSALTSHQNNYLLKPDKVKVDFNQNDFSADQVKAGIEFENNEMSYAFLQNFLLLGGSGSAGSFSLSNDLSDFFLTGIEQVADIICEAINKCVIPHLVRMNFGPQEEYPRLTCSGISDAIGKEFAEMMKYLADGGYITPDEKLEENIRKRLKLPEIDHEGQKQSALPMPPQVDEEGNPIPPEENGGNGAPPKGFPPKGAPKKPGFPPKKLAEKKSLFR